MSLRIRLTALKRLSPFLCLCSYPLSEFRHTASISTFSALRRAQRGRTPICSKILRRVSLSIVGVLQYIAPTLQLLLGVFFFGEAFGSDRAIGFAFIWTGLAVFAADGVIASRRRVVAQQA